MRMEKLNIMSLKTYIKVTGVAYQSIIYLIEVGRKETVYGKNFTSS